MSFAESTSNHHQILLQLKGTPNWSHETKEKPALYSPRKASALYSSRMASTVYSPRIASNTRKASDYSPSRKASNNEYSPSRKASNTIISMMDIESTLQDTPCRENQFDSITTKVNNTIEELKAIYNQIGYSNTETSIKSSEIFQVIEETISSFTNNLRREKNNIENEIEWLRQQIRFILAMINDHAGDKCLTLVDKGIVFQNQSMYEEGYKEEILNKLTNLQNRRDNFYANSPFNDSGLISEDNSPGLPEDTISLQNQYEYMIKNTPTLSLLQTKSKLNVVFLEVLKTFVGTFKKLNICVFSYLDSIETIGEHYSPHANISMLKTLPNREEAEQHRKLIEEFESTLKDLKLSDGKTNVLRQNDNEYIISSPRKVRSNERALDNGEEHELHLRDKGEAFDNLVDMEPKNVETLMENLRDLNYSIVRVIRGLKLTKITSDTLSNIQKEIEYCEAEIEVRLTMMRDIISNCLGLINTLHLNEDQLISIQRHYDISGKSDNGPMEGYFDSETLRFIQSNPREFGLMTHHLEFINKLYDILTKIRDTKQKKWDYYLESCTVLWEKLGESREHVETFLDKNSSLTDIALMNFKMELNRLYLKRSEYIESFIVDTRQEIESLWSQMFYSDEQKRQFKHWDYDINDDTLDRELVFNEHEKELANLKKEWDSKLTIFEIYSQINSLLDDQKFLEDSSKDSSRLLSKNSCKILLKEEKIRKSINKNMPKLIEDLKREIIEFNNAQLSKDSRPITINGEDFFERVLFIETQQLLKGRSRLARANSQVKTPRMSQSLRSSPTKMAANGKFATSRMRAVSPKSVKRSKSVLTPSFSSNIKQPLTKLKGQNNLTSEPVSRLESPQRNLRQHTRIDSRHQFKVSRIATHLQPLNSPLIAFNENNDLHHDDNTIHSNISRLSPLKINNESNIPTSFSKQTLVSPVKGYDFVDSSPTQDKENRSHHGDRFGLSPIKVIPVQSESRQSSNAFSSMTDSSTIIGDDYQVWKDERIRQLNSFRS